MNPPALIQNGRPQFGLFDDALAVNIADYQHRSVTGGNAGFLSRWLGYKRFQYFGILSEQFMGGCAIAHLRHTAIAFVYVYSPAEGMLFEKTLRAPLGLGCRLSDSPLSGTSHFRFGKTRIELGYRDQPRSKSLNVDVAGRLHIAAEFDESAHHFEPMSLCTRTGRNGWVYAHKVAAVAATGRLECQGRSFDLEQCKAWAHHDFSAGYMRRETFWNWACFSGQTSDGAALGLNVSCGVNETSYSENCFWQDGRRQLLGLCQFDYDWDQPAARSWHISNQDGRLQLRFDPLGEHTEKLKLLLVASDFKQIFGHFSGHIEISDGQRIAIDRMPGFVEDQYAKW